MRLSVTTPRGAVVETDIEEITAPGSVGEFGVLPGHVPMMAALKPGVLSYRMGERTSVLAVREGFLQVAPTPVADKTTDRVLVLVGEAVAASAIDPAAAKKDFADAEAALGNWKGEQDGAYQALIDRRDWSLAKMGAASRAHAS